MSKHAFDMFCLASVNWFIYLFILKNCIKEILLVNLSSLDFDSKGQRMKSEGSWSKLHVLTLQG